MTQFRKSRLAPVCAFTSSLLFIAGLAQAVAQDGSHHGPSQMRVELENAAMTVLRVTLGPHEQTGMHDVNPRLIIWLTDAHLRDRMADGSARDYQRRAGTVEWVSAQRHAGENLSDEPIEFLAVVPTAASHEHR